MNVDKKQKLVSENQKRKELKNKNENQERNSHKKPSVASGVCWYFADHFGMFCDYFPQPNGIHCVEI